jgi:hypothetical protein
VDTRTKIVSSAVGFVSAKPLLLVVGRFDLLRLEVARELAAAKERTGARCLAVAVRPLVDELAPLAARAEMAAALRVVDYVFVVTDGDLAALETSLHPIEIVNMEEADRRRTRELVEHVVARRP